MTKTESCITLDKHTEGAIFLSGLYNMFNLNHKVIGIVQYV